MPSSALLDGNFDASDGRKWKRRPAAFQGARLDRKLDAYDGRKWKRRPAAFQGARLVGDFSAYDGYGGGFAFGADPVRNAGLSSSTWTLTDRYLWDPANGQVLADEQVPAGGYTLWPLPDNQGTVRDIVTASGQYSADDGSFSEPSAGSDLHIAYTPFGAPLNNTAVDFLFGYDGELYDQDTHLQQMGRRWYDPLNERWLSQDPIFPNAGANPYEAFDNSPTNFVDPSGRSPQPPPPGGWNRLGKNLAWYYTTAGSGYLGGMGHGDPMAAFWAARPEYAAWRNSNRQTAHPPALAAVPMPPGPPPFPVPGGGAGNGWKWNPSPPGSGRPGKWGPQTSIPGQSQPSTSWDPLGHWDLDDGLGSRRQHFAPDGTALTPEEAHPPKPIVNPPPDTGPNAVVQTAGEVAGGVTVGVIIYWTVSEGLRILFPPRNLVPIP